MYRTASAAEIALAIPQPVTLGGIIHPHSDDTLAFTPDSNTVFFDRSSGPHKTIMISHKINGRWSNPQVANFSGHDSVASLMTSGTVPASRPLAPVATVLFAAARPAFGTRYYARLPPQ